MHSGARGMSSAQQKGQRQEFSLCCVVSLCSELHLTNHKISSIPFAGPVFGDLLDFTGAGFCRLLKGVGHGWGMAKRG